MKFYVKMLLWVAVVVIGGTADAQQGTKSDRGLDVALSYTFSYANTTRPESFWLNGGSAEIHGQFWKGWGAVGRVDVQHTSNMQGTGVGLDLVNATFGPRYTWHPKRSRFGLYGEALGGVSIGRNSEFPTSEGIESSQDSAAFMLGGGVDYHVKNWLGIRILDAHWMRTDFSNLNTGNQNTLVAGSGIVFHLP